MPKNRKFSRQARLKDVATSRTMMSRHNYNIEKLMFSRSNGVRLNSLGLVGD